MPSAIDPTEPKDGVPASKASLRDNLAVAKTELEHGGFFTQGGSGAVERLVEEKLREVKSITDFGAVGDNATDNGLAINAAADAARAAANNDEGVLHIPAGIFRTSQTLDFTGLTVVGSQQGSILKLANNANTDLVSVANGTVLRDLRLDGNKSNQDRAACKAGDTGHVVRGGNEVRIDYCRIVDAANCCVKGTANEFHLNHCEIGQATFWNVDWANTPDASISDCAIFFGGVTGYDDDGTVTGNVRIGSEQVLITHNHIWQALGQNVLVNAQRGSIIANNRMDGPTRENILVTGCMFIQIYNNLLFDAGVNRNGRDTHTNAFRRSQIRIDGASALCEVKNNNCKTAAKSFGGESWLDESDYGIYLSGNGHVIEHNVVVAMKSDGIFVQGRHNTIRSNTIYGATAYGINADSGVGHEILENTIRLCGNGVNVDASDCIIDRNYVVEAVANASTILTANEGVTTSLNVNDETGFGAEMVAIECDKGIWQIRRVNSTSAGILTLNRSIYGAGTIASIGNAVTTRRVATGINLTAGSSNNIGTGNRVLRQSGTAIVDAGTSNAVGTL